jgi:hypothetical protein
MIRSLRTRLAAVVLAAPLGACCSDCIKDPPCRCYESPCCLTPLQRTALEKKTHALPTPAVYLYKDQTYVLFTEKGQKDFDKDPADFEAKGAVRLIRDQTWRVDMDPGPDYDIAGVVAGIPPIVK